MNVDLRPRKKNNINIILKSTKLGYIYADICNIGYCNRLKIVKSQTVKSKTTNAQFFSIKIIFSFKDFFSSFKISSECKKLIILISDQLRKKN